MPNFAGALKGEITRLARKEVRAGVTPLKKIVAGLRRRVAQQKRLIRELERSLKRGANAASRAVEAPESEGSQIRFSPAWVKQHRKKLKMSRRVYAKLVGVSAQSIFGWETGRTRPRRSALQTWRRLRGMGVRELRALQGTAGTRKRGRPARKTRRVSARSGMRRAAKKK